MTRSDSRLARPFAVFALLVAAALLPAAFAGCETVKGAGQDIQNLGEAGERAIEGDDK